MHTYVESTAFIVIPNPFLKFSLVVVCRRKWDRRGQWWRHRTHRALYVSLVDRGCVDELAATSLSELTAPTDGNDSGMIPSCSLRYSPLILLDT